MKKIHGDKQLQLCNKLRLGTWNIRSMLQLGKVQLLINVDKTKVMASDGKACRILIQNQQLEQMDTLP